MSSGPDDSTHPERDEWPATGPAYRRSEVSAVVGHGEADWARQCSAILRWEVKTRSGFAVSDASPVVAGARLRITARVAGITVVEPVEVVAVVHRTDRVGFSYRTLPGHPVDGEEAFVLHRSGDVVSLSIRSLTRPAAKQPWRALHPVLRLAQRVARRRYLRALVA